MKYVIMEAHNKHSLLHSQRLFQIFSNNSLLRILGFFCIVSAQSHASVRFHNRLADDGEFFTFQTNRQTEFLPVLQVTLFLWQLLCSDAGFVSGMMPSALP